MDFDIHHFGFLTDSIDRSLKTFDLLGYDRKIDFLDEVQNIKLTFLIKNTTVIELIEPLPDSKIIGLLKRFNNSIYHTAYSVRDIDEAYEFLKQEKQIRPLSEKISSPFFQKQIQFFLLDGSIIELIQK